MKKKVFLSITLALCLFSWAYFRWQVHWVHSPSEDPVWIEIPEESPFSIVTKTLHEQGLIRNEGFIKLYARLSGIDKRIQSGRFRIEPYSSPYEILQELSDPNPIKTQITITPGQSSYDIDRTLSKRQLIEEGSFIAYVKEHQLEGRLAPETYSIIENQFQIEDFAQQSESAYEELMKDFRLELGASPRSETDILIMASILEREAQNIGDMKLIAGILWKRLDEGWPLQSDVTLLYGKNKSTLTYDELQEDRPYNSYTRSGLPAGPISNPSAEAIRAALSPRKSEYWYYLATPNGTVLYSETNAEHEEKKQLHL